VGKGVLVVIGCTVGAIILGFGLAVGSLSGILGWVLLLGIGLVQAAWIVPLWLSFRRRRETETAKGVLIMASVVFLLNAGCWGLVASLSIHH
jgi:hypothetical protein